MDQRVTLWLALAISIVGLSDTAAAQYVPTCSACYDNEDGGTNWGGGFGYGVAAVRVRPGVYGYGARVVGGRGVFYYSAHEFSLSPANSRAFGTKTTPFQMPSPN